MKVLIALLFMVMCGVVMGHSVTSIATCQWAADHTIILDSQSDQQKLLVIVAKTMVVEKCLGDVFLANPASLFDRVLIALGNASVAGSTQK